MLALSSKLPATPTNIFTTMSMLATQHRAINLGQGFPDYAMNPELIELVNKAMQDGYNQYPHSNGYPPLREQIGLKTYKLYGASVDSEEEITITPGGTYAIFTALTAILQPGDEVIIFQPCYDSYIPNVLVNGAIPVLINLDYPSYTINWPLVKTKISGKTKAIIINTPHNPTGTILSRSDILALEKLVENTNIIVISDEVYEHLTYDNESHNSVLKNEALRKRSFVCSSFGKTFHCTGWKTGYVIAPSSLMQLFRKIHQYNCFSVDASKQVALASFLQDETHYSGLSAFMQQKRDFFYQQMQGSRFRLMPCNGSYFMLANYAAIDNKTSELAMAERITIDYGVTAIPVSAFYQNETDNKVLRFCFAKKEETLALAAEKLSKV